MYFKPPVETPWAVGKVYVTVGKDIVRNEETTDKS